MTSIQDELLSPTERSELIADPKPTTSRSERTPGSSQSQWRLTNIQVINWGGFDGPHTATFHPDATLLSGGSGTGKSTLLDAYTALMMPSRIAFNGASNDSGSGRARNEAGGQRTLLTYLRGKQGVNDESGGARSENILRGKGAPTWGAVAATFANGHGEAHTALRMFFVPVHAADVPAISQRMALVPSAITLTDVAAEMATYTSEKKLAGVITTTWPEARVYRQYSEFSNALFTRLGIGSGGDGVKALDLLARIQAGRSVNSVNALFRDLVLDTPETFDHADRALAHFDTLDEGLARIIETEKQHQTLSGIREMWTKYDDANTRAAALDQYGLNVTGFTKLTAWSLTTEGDVLDRASDLARTHHTNAQTLARAANTRAEELYDELETARADYQASGGDELAGLERKISSTREDLAVATRAHEDLTALADTVDVTFNSRADFDALHHEASTAEERIRVAENKLVDDRDHLRDALKDLDGRRRQLQADRDHLNKSGTRIRADLGTLRARIAAVLGLTPQELPFLAELIDLRPGEEPWRSAAEKVLGGDASRIVLPIGRRREISRLLEGTQVPREVRFLDGDDTIALQFPHSGTDSREHTNRLIAKLQFAEHPYAGWVQAHLTGSGLNALCVERPEDLDGGGLRVTRAGQTRSGIRSSIGRNSTHNIIGFSSAEELAKVEAELSDVERANSEATAAMGTIKDQQTLLGTRKVAFVRIQGFTWDAVDVGGITGRLEALVARLDELTQADDTLQRLREQIQELEATHKQAMATHAQLDHLAGQAGKTWASLIERKDHVTDQLDRYAGDEAYDLHETQQADLHRVYAEARAHTDEDPIIEADRFGERMGAVQVKLHAESERAYADANAAEAELTRTFRLYQASWEDPNLSTNLASYPDYLRILDQLETEGLFSTRADWQRTVADWSGQDLVPLWQSLTGEIDTIKARVEPINDILATLRFGARGGRLRLKVDEVTSESVRQFRKQLRKLTTLATKQMDFDQTRRAFNDLSAFMDLLREPGDARYKADRSDRVKLLDVRRHVEVYAVEYPVDDATWAAREHRQLGEASGGESQELIAFIIGSALRFRLGDELRDRPRFTPVFLDEGFVKADSEFSGRAVSAWRGLGFQIVIGSPEDKFTGLERHMEAFIVTYKDTVSGRCYLDHVADHESALASRQSRASVDVGGV